MRNAEQHYFTDTGLHIFAWSGTLVDDRPDVFQANMLLLQKHKVETRGITLEDWFHGPAGGNASRYLTERFGGTPEDYYPAYSHVLDEIRKHSPPPPLRQGALELLQRLSVQGCRITVISAHPEHNLHTEIEQHGFYEYIDWATGSVTDKTEAILGDLVATGIQPEHTAYTGDMDTDIAAANQAGAMAVAAAGGYHSVETLKAANPDLLILNLPAFARYGQ